MAVDRLNTFRGFLTKKESHEDHLTRALMVLMRLVPEAHGAFLAEVSCRRTSAVPSLPALPDHQGLGITTWRTQTGDLTGMTGRLISVVIAMDGPTEPIPVVRAARNAVYDGVIGYGTMGTFTVEVKTCPKQDFVRQASPDASSVTQFSDGDIESPAVVIRWPDLLRRIATLMKQDGIANISRTLLGDFMAYAHEVFPWLNPFDRLSMCRESLELLDERCAAILEAIGPHRVAYHTGWHYSLRFEAGAVREVALFAERLAESIVVTLEFEPGDTKAQSDPLYESLDIEALLALQGQGWSITPNFHLNYRQDGIVHASTSMPLDRYLLAAQSGKTPRGSVRLKGADDAQVGFSLLLDRLCRGGVMDVADVEAAHARFTDTRRERANFNPGIKMLFHWPLSDAAALDDQGTFIDTVRLRIREAFSTWKQHDSCLSSPLELPPA